MKQFLKLNRLVLTVALLAMTLALIAFPVNAQAQGATAKYRFVHAVPNAAAVDIVIDGKVAVRGLEYGKASRYIVVAEGDHAISVALTGTSGSIVSMKDTIKADSAKTFIANGVQAAVLSVYDDELAPLKPGQTRFTAAHVIAGAPSVDILQLNPTLGDLVLIAKLGYGVTSGSVDISAASGSLAVVPAGELTDKALITSPVLPLVAGTHNMLIVLGTADGAPAPSVLLLTTPVHGTEGTGLVRLVHGNVEAPAVDVYVNGDLVAPAVQFGNATPHISFPAGTAELAVRAAGSASDSPAILSAQITVEAGKAQTVVIAGDATTPKAVVSADDISPLDAGKVRVNVINATTANGATAQFGSGAPVAFTSAGAPVELVPGIYETSVEVAELGIKAGANLPLSGGVLYDAIIAGSPADAKLIVAATGLNEQPGSAPEQAFPAAAVVAAPAVTATPAEAVAVAPTVAPTDGAVAVQPTVAPTEVVVAAQPTTDINSLVATAVAATLAAAQPPATVAPVEPVAQPTDAPVVVEPTTVPEEVVTATPVEIVAPVAPTTGILGVVNLNEGVNLKIYEYPLKDAKTLGLVPAGTTLSIIGIDGPEAGPDGTPGPTSTPSTETPKINDIWVFVSWLQEDGGELTGWTRPQYLQISRNGKNVFEAATIATFPLVPRNKFGEVKTGNATPIPVPANIIAGTVNVDPGVNLQMRRTPDRQGESLALLQAGTEVEILGYYTVFSPTPTLDAQQTPVPSEIWYFVRYTTDTGNVTGYVKSDYITVSKNKKKVELKDIPVIKDPQAGEVNGQFTPPTLPPVAGLIAFVDRIDANANLQLRRNPDATSEGLALIPSGSQLEVLGRNGDGNWIKISFNGIEGWINSLYVTIRKNGKLFKLVDVTNITDQVDIAASITPGPTPTATPAG